MNAAPRRARAGGWQTMVLLGCLATIAHANVLVPMTIEQLASEAEVVLHGTVESVSCQRQAIGRLYTRVELKIAEVWRGEVAQSTFTIVLAGGTLGSTRVVVEGQAQYRPGEEVVVLLKRNERGEGVTLSLSQGKFDVWQHPVSGVKYAHNPFLGQPMGPMSREATTDGATRPLLRLDELRRRVTAVMPGRGKAER